MTRYPARLAALAALAAILALPASAFAAVEIHPYGFILASYVQSWGRPNNVEVPSQAASGDSLAASNQNTSIFSARQSRLGLNLAGGKGPKDSDLSGALEADFYGLRNSGSSGFDVLASAPRLRLAYIQAKDGRDAVVFGQDFTKAFAPLNPVSLEHVGTAPLTNSGNLWNRIPQLRWDRSWAPADGWAVNTKVALVRAFTADETGRTTKVNTTTFAVPVSVDAAGSGEFSGGPAYQALAEVQRKIDGRVCLAGVSVQHVRESFNAAVPAPAGASNHKVSGWLWAAHFDLPVLSLFGVSGEAFYGRGNQNVNGLGSVYSDLGEIRLSQVRGGWAQAAVKPVKDWRVNAMAGYESLDQLGLASATIYRNETAAVNAMWDVSPELTLAVELGRIHSYYVKARAGDSENAGFSAQYRF